MVGVVTVLGCLGSLMEGAELGQRPLKFLLSLRVRLDGLFPHSYMQPSALFIGPSPFPSEEFL